MDAIQFSEYLKEKYACREAKSWAMGKSWQEVYNTCHRGDWLLWLYPNSKGYELQKMTLAKGLCANTVRHLMKDERSLKSVDAAIAFGKGEISIDELNAAAYGAYAAYRTAYGAYAAAYAAHAAAACATDATAAYSAHAHAARNENLQMTADIVREVLPFDIWVL